MTASDIMLLPHVRVGARKMRVKIGRVWRMWLWDKEKLLWL